MLRTHLSLHGNRILAATAFTVLWLVGSRGAMAIGGEPATAATSLATTRTATLVKTNPVDGADDVDPALKELRIVFDQPMSPHGTLSGRDFETYPAFTAGTIHWENDQAFVAEWRLRPQHEYWVKVEFQTSEGEHVKAVVLDFHTRADANATTQGTPAATHSAPAQSAPTQSTTQSSGMQVTPLPLAPASGNYK